MSKTIFFVVLASVAQVIFGADHNLFKNCSRTFCAELRNYDLSEDEIYGAEFVSINEVYQLEFNVTKASSDRVLKLLVSVPYNFDNNAIYRIEIDDRESPRYKLQQVLSEGVGTNNKTVNTDSFRVKREVGKTSIIRDDPDPLAVVVIHGPPFSIVIFRDVDIVLTIDGNSFLWQDETERFAFTVTYNISRSLYGLFHHADTFVLRETADGSTDPYRLRNSDNYGYDANSTMAMYGSVPVVFGHSSNWTGGVFLHNAAEQWVDISYQGSTSARFLVDAGAFDLFVLVGPTPPKAVSQLTYLTGVAHLPQLWTLGYHQSRWSYYTQEEVENVVANMDANDFPLDVIWLDLDYTDGKRYFTWNPENFTDPLALQRTINSTNRKLVAVLDPHIKVDDSYVVYTEAKARGLFVKNIDGSDFEGECWPGLASYLDFLNDNTTEFYANLHSYDNFVNTSEVIGGIWNDMNEPSVFDDSLEKTLPFNTTHYGGVQHKNVHNIFGFLQTRATHLGLMRRDNGTRRPFILSRSHFAGSQRYAAMWTGDNTASWEHLAVTFSECLTAGLLGQPWCGADIGGFTGDDRSDELVYRWYQSAAWLPFFRGHAEEGQPRREPYVYPKDVQNRIRDAIKIRYKHVHYWYMLFFEHTRTGAPMIRPLFYHYPEDPDAPTIENQLLLGNTIMVRQVAQPNVTSVDVYFPGVDEFWFQDNDNTVHQGLKWENISVNANFIPIYYRAGSVILTKATERPSTKDMEPDPFDVFVYLNRNQTAKGVLYFDDWTTFEYQNNYAYGYYNLDFDGNVNVITFTVVDDFANPTTSARLGDLYVHSLPEDSERIATKKIYTHSLEGIPLTDIDLVSEVQKQKKFSIKL